MSTPSQHKKKSDEEDISGDFSKAFQAIHEGAQKTGREFNKIVALVEKNSVYLEPIMWWIQEKLKAVREALLKLMNKVHYAIQHQVPVISLISTGFRWLHEIMTPLSDVFTDLSQHEHNENFNKWKGDARTTYDGKVTQQKDAVTAAKNRAKFISPWLVKIAKTNVDYAVSLAKVLIKVAGTLAQAVLEAETVVGIPGAVDKLAKVIVDLADEALNELLTIGQRFFNQEQNILNLEEAMNDYTGLPNHKWPETVYG